MTPHFFCTLCGTLLVACVAGCSSSEESRQREQLSFGDRQIEQMLSDRPDMQGVLGDDHPVLAWAKEVFDGKQYGYRVYWNADTPESGEASECSPRYGGYPAFVRVSGGTELTPIDRWATIIYELHNLNKSDDFYEDLLARVMEGEVSGEEYAMACVESEYAALQKTHAFFEANPFPQSKHGRDRFHQELIMATPDSFAAYCDRYEAAGMRPGNYDYFLNYYDESLKPYIKAKSDHESAEAISGEDELEGE